MGVPHDTRNVFNNRCRLQGCSTGGAVGSVTQAHLRPSVDAAYAGCVTQDQYPVDDGRTPLHLTPAARLSLLVAGLVVTIEAVAVLAFVVADLAGLDAARVGLGIGVAVFLGGYGLGQLLAVVLLLRGRSGARGPLVMTQLIQLGLAWNLRGADTGDLQIPNLGALLAGAAVVALGGLLSPPVNRAFAVADGTAEPDPPPEGRPDV